MCRGRYDESIPGGSVEGNGDRIPLTLAAPKRFAVLRAPRFGNLR